MSGKNPREIAVEVLQRRENVAKGGKFRPGNAPFIEDLLEDALTKAHLSRADRGLCQELVYGVVRWQGTLDWLIEEKATASPPGQFVRNLLRLGLYQIFWLDRIPDHAAVNETVEIGKGKGFRAQAGFVNAVLRGYLRERESTQARLKELEQSDPALGHSHPQWLFERWRRIWGEEQTGRLMQWNNQPPKTFARVNMLRADPGKLLARWREEGVDYDFVRHDWLGENEVFMFKSHPPIAQLGTFREGLFYVQDPSTLLAVQELNPQPGEVILDLCAAPGGKLTYIAQRLRNEGKIVGHDLSTERLGLIKENCARLGVTCVKAMLADEFSNSSGLNFDRVLVDAPCSNTGVMRRRVDLRWRVTQEEIVRLQAVQTDLLHRAALVLRPGGELIYSTCSLEPEENGRVVEQFVGEHRGFKLLKETRLLPWVDGVDGAYVAHLRRS